MNIFLLFLLNLSGTALDSENDSITDYESILRNKNPDLKTETLPRTKRSFCLEEMCEKQPLPLEEKRDWCFKERNCISLQPKALNQNLLSKQSGSISKIPLKDGRFDIKAYLENEQAKKNGDNKIESSDNKIKNSENRIEKNNEKNNNLKKNRKSFNSKNPITRTKNNQVNSALRNSKVRSVIPKLNVKDNNKSIDTEKSRKSVNESNKLNIKNSDSLVSFGSKSYEQIHLEEIELPLKIKDHELKLQKMRISVENLSNRLKSINKRNFLFKETEIRDKKIEKIDNTVKLSLKCIEKSSLIYEETLKIIDEVPSDDQYEHLMRLNSIFDKCNIFRDKLINEIDTLLIEIKTSFLLMGALETFENKINSLIYHIEEELKELEVFMANIKRRIPTSENYSRDYEILIRIFEYLYALVFIEDYRINNDKIENDNRITDKIFQFEDIPFPFLNDIFSHDVGQFFIIGNNNKEKYWSELRNFVSELEKYSEILLFEVKCSIMEFFNEINRIFAVISEDKESKYQDIANRIVQSNIITAVRDEIVLIKTSEIEKDELHSEIEFLLLETLDCYLLIE